MSKEETINKTLEDIKNVKLYTEEQVIEILWECVDNIESSYNIHEVTEEFIKNRFLNQNKEDGETDDTGQDIAIDMGR
jgi:hypothetical protein